MVEKRIIIIGGGLAGLSAGCYALRNGFECTIVEHSPALGGVCTAWTRGAYLVDGCIHWLMGGAYQRVYEELDILPELKLRMLERWTTYRDVRDGFEFSFDRDLDGFVRRLRAIAPEDASEIARIRRAARELCGAWQTRAATLTQFRKPLGVWVREHLRSERLRRMFTRVLPEDAPASFMLMVLGYLERGFLSRPVGGTAAFRDALERSYRRRGGSVQLNSTVDEVLVEHGRATGVRLSDGTQLASDAVISTASAPESVLRLLGGRFDAGPTRERLERWALAPPIVLASFGVAQAYADKPSLWLIDGLAPFDTGDRVGTHLYVRVCNDDPCFAPAGHSVVQTILATNYDWWASRGAGHAQAKEQLAELALSQLAPHFPELRASLRMTDIATPITYQQHARSWRGAYQGWVPNADSLLGHVSKTLRGLSGFYMAGQWVEPGGGIPLSITSGRQVVELICRDQTRAFTH